jgi:tryptophan-rich sensory protein
MNPKGRDVLRDRVAPAAGTLAAAAAGGLATDPGSSWFRQLDKPSWYPPPATFGIVWSGLYAATAWAAGAVLTRAAAERRPFARALAGNLLLNAAWTPLFFRAHRPWAAAAALVPYAGWTAFATALSAAIARRNPRR